MEQPERLSLGACCLRSRAVLTLRCEVAGVPAPGSVTSCEGCIIQLSTYFFSWLPASTTDLLCHYGLFWPLLDFWLILDAVPKPALLFLLRYRGAAAPAGLAVTLRARLDLCRWEGALVGREQRVQPMGCEPPPTGGFHSPRELQGIWRLVIQMEENRAHT